MYVEDKKGKRIICPHPGEMGKVKSVLGKNISEKVFREKTGFNSYSICLDCLYQFEADLRDEKNNPWRFYYGNLYQQEAYLNTNHGLSWQFLSWADLDDEKSNPQRFVHDTKEKDRRECPKCKSQNVKTVFELIGKICPKCKKGIIKEIETGWIC